MYTLHLAYCMMTGEIDEILIEQSSRRYERPQLKGLHSSDSLRSSAGRKAAFAIQRSREHPAAVQAGCQHAGSVTATREDALALLLPRTPRRVII